MLKVETGFKLPAEFSEKGSEKTLAQAIHVYVSRSHYGVAKVKGRGEINRTTKKVYKQKGTGGARHGARSAPIFVGGGVTFGPREAKRELKLPNGLKRSALKVALSLKVKEEKVFVVSGLSTVKKTKEMAEALKKISPKAKKFVVALAPSNMDKVRFVRNIKGVMVLPYTNLNAHIVFLGGVLIIDSEVFKKETVKAEVKKAEKPAKAVKPTKAVKKTVKKVAKKTVKKGSK